jgi:hypothetical protein
LKNGKAENFRGGFTSAASKNQFALRADFFHFVLLADDYFSTHSGVMGSM